VKREHAVGDAEDQQQDDGEQKPGAVLIHINELFFVASYLIIFYHCDFNFKVLLK
jgi:hypothetical protein